MELFTPQNTPRLLTHDPKNDICDFKNVYINNIHEELNNWRMKKSFERAQNNLFNYKDSKNILTPERKTRDKYNKNINDYYKQIKLKNTKINGEQVPVNIKNVEFNTTNQNQNQQQFKSTLGTKKDVKKSKPSVYIENLPIYKNKKIGQRQKQSATNRQLRSARVNHISTLDKMKMIESELAHFHSVDNKTQTPRRTIDKVFGKRNKRHTDNSKQLLKVMKEHKLLHDENQRLLDENKRLQDEKISLPTEQSVDTNDLITMTDNLFPDCTVKHSKHKITPVQVVQSKSNHIEDFDAKTTKIFDSLKKMNSKIQNLEQNYFVKSNTNNIQMKIQTFESKLNNKVKYKSVHDFETQIDQQEQLCGTIESDWIKKVNIGPQNYNEQVDTDESTAEFKDCTTDINETEKDEPKSVNNCLKCESVTNQQYLLHGDTIYTSSGLMISTIYPSNHNTTTKSINHCNLLDHKFKSHAEQINDNIYDSEIMKNCKNINQLQKYIRKQNYKEPKAYTDIYENLQQLFYDNNSIEQASVNNEGTIGLNTDYNLILSPRSADLLESSAGTNQFQSKNVQHNEYLSDLQNAIKNEHIDIYTDVMHSNFLQKELNFQPDHAFLDAERKSRTQLHQQFNDDEEDQWENIETDDVNDITKNFNVQILPSVDIISNNNNTDEESHKVEDIRSPRTFANDMSTLEQYIRYPELEQTPRNQSILTDDEAQKLIASNAQLVAENQKLLDQLKQIKNTKTTTCDTDENGSQITVLTTTSKRSTARNSARRSRITFNTKSNDFLSGTARINRINNRVNQVIDQLEKSNGNIMNLLQMRNNLPRRKRHPLIGIYDKYFTQANNSVANNFEALLPDTHQLTQTKKQSIKTDYFKNSIDFIKQNIHTETDNTKSTLNDVDSTKIWSSIFNNAKQFQKH